MVFIKLFIFTFLTSTLLSCTVYPKKITYFDEKCGITSEKLVLKTNPSVNRCEKDDDCIKNILPIMVNNGIERIVAGSIVIAGNTIYWLKKQGECKEIN